MKIINFLSFYGGLYKIQRLLNSTIDRPEIIDTFPESHPRGFIKKFRKRRITIVESYLKIIGYLGSQKCKERLEALKLLTEQVLHSRALKMPLNTARVQLALMKEAVKNRENKRIQLELLRDFSISSFGQPKFIRKYLNELNIIEVPEKGQQLKDLDMGWDSHVHDNSSYGRKTPTQLIIDSFIKGISEITIAYNSISHIEIMNEAIEAGNILGIKVNIGVEFSVGKSGNRFHYIYLFPYFIAKKEFKDFLRVNKEDLAPFIKSLEENQNNRIQSIDNFIRNFNNTYRAKLNYGFQKGSIYYLDKLSINGMKEIIPLKHATRMHLGELLYTKLKPVLFNRVLYLKSLKIMSSIKYKGNQISGWEYRNIEKKYETARKHYRELNPENLRLKYFPDSITFEYKTVLNSLDDIFKSIKNDSLIKNCIKTIHPLEHGFKEGVRVILDNFRYIKYVEIYNLHDSIYRDHNELLLFTRFIELLNTGNIQQLQVFLKEQNIRVNKKKIKEYANYCGKVNLIPTCGSDSTGRTSYIPGMGFIFRKTLVKKQNMEYVKKHHTLPHFVSEIISSTPVTGEVSSSPDSTIISMGKSIDISLNEIGDENVVQPIPIKRAWRYLNPSIKNILYIMIGFIPAYLVVGLKYSLIWFGITLIRNGVTDIISGRGYRPKEWHFKNINFDNLSHSLFWTGFSVPLLGFVKYQFDILYPLAKGGMLFEFTKFFFICIVNGTYISAHNSFRGFEKTTVRINFFRSMLAWPFAAAFAPVGNIIAIPSIVQAKFWSDFIAGLIEGTGKFTQRINLRKRDLKELLPNIRSNMIEKKYIAVLDLLYFFRKDPRTKNSLSAILFQQQSIFQKLRDIIGFNKGKVKQNFDDYFNLVNWFSDSSNFFKLTDFILANYKKEQVVYLTDLVSDKFIDFYKWLLRNRPKGV